MRLILVGPPGSGKGTQAELLCQRLGMLHFSTGDVLREAIRLNTPLGEQAKPYMNHGKLVPDDLVNEVVAERFRRDRPEKFVMDGYPRTVAQAASFDQVLRQQFLGLDAVVFLLVEDEEIVQRMSGRWSCSRCPATYHTLKKPPRAPGVCDACGHPLMQRPDDKEETVRERLRVYHRNTEGLIPHYKAQGLLREVAGVGSIEEIYAKILRSINYS